MQVEIERRFLVTGDISRLNWPVDFHDYYIGQDYLIKTDPKVSERVRSCKDLLQGEIRWYHTKKKRIDKMSCEEQEVEISEEDAAWLLTHADPTRGTVWKIRRVFAFNGLIFELDTFRDLPLKILEVEIEDREQFIVLPDFLGALIEVTEDRTLSNRSLALRVPVWTGVPQLS